MGIPIFLDMLDNLTPAGLPENDPPIAAATTIHHSTPPPSVPPRHPHRRLTQHYQSHRQQNEEPQPILRQQPQQGRRQSTNAATQDSSSQSNAREPSALFRYYLQQQQQQQHHQTSTPLTTPALDHGYDRMSTRVGVQSGRSSSPTLPMRNRERMRPSMDGDQEDRHDLEQQREQESEHQRGLFERPLQRRQPQQMDQDQRIQYEAQERNEPQYHCLDREYEQESNIWTGPPSTSRHHHRSFRTLGHGQHRSQDSDSHQSSSPISSSLFPSSPTTSQLESATRTNSIGNHFFRALSSSDYPPPTIIVQFVEPCSDYGGALRNHEEFRVVARSLNMPIVEVCSLMPVLNAMCCAIENPAELWKLAQIPVVRHLWRGMSLRSVDSAFARPVRTNDTAPMQQQQQALMQAQGVSPGLDMMARRRFGHTGLSQGSMPYQTLDRSSPSTVDNSRVSAQTSSGNYAISIEEQTTLSESTTATSRSQEQRTDESILNRFRGDDVVDGDSLWPSGDTSTGVSSAVEGGALFSHTRPSSTLFISTPSPSLPSWSISGRLSLAAESSSPSSTSTLSGPIESTLTPPTVNANGHGPLSTSSQARLDRIDSGMGSGRQEAISRQHQQSPSPSFLVSPSPPPSRLFLYRRRASAPALHTSLECEADQGNRSSRDASSSSGRRSAEMTRPLRYFRQTGGRRGGEGDLGPNWTLSNSDGVQFYSPTAASFVRRANEGRFPGTEIFAARHGVLNRLADACSDSEDDALRLAYRAITMPALLSQSQQRRASLSDNQAQESRPSEIGGGRGAVDHDRQRQQEQDEFQSQEMNRNFMHTNHESSCPQCLGMNNATINRGLDEDSDTGSILHTQPRFSDTLDNSLLDSNNVVSDSSQRVALVNTSKPRPC